MKTRLPRLLLALAILVGIFPVIAFGQQPASVTWNLVAPDSVRPSTIVGQLTADTISGSTFFIRDYTGGECRSTRYIYEVVAGNRRLLGTGNHRSRRSLHSACCHRPNRETHLLPIQSVSGQPAAALATCGSNFYFSTDPTFVAKTILNSDTAINLPHATNVGAKRYAYAMQEDRERRQRPCISASTRGTTARRQLRSMSTLSLL